MDNYLDAERLVVGGLLLDNSAIAEITLTPFDFCDAQMGQVFRAIRSLEASKKPFDVFTVGDELERSTGKNWMALVATLVKNTPSSSNIRVYAEHVKRYRKNREARAIAQTLIETIGHEETAIDQAISGLMGLHSTSVKNVFSMKDALKDAVDHVDKVFKAGGDLTGITTGLKDFDVAMGGFQDSDLIVIGARPAMGKTALLLNFMLASGSSCSVFSAEMSAMQLALRSLSIQAKLDSWLVRTAKFGEEDWPKFSNAVSQLASMPIHIDQSTAPTIAQVQQSARKLKQKHDTKIVFVDYIQKLRGNNPRASRIDQVGDVVMGLKDLAKELNCPVVALAQVNREVEKRANRRPLMGDLANSSEIEKEADIIAMLYRDEVYNEDTDEKGIAEINIEKNRHGPTGEIRTAWLASYMKFADLTVQWHQSRCEEHSK